MTTASASLEIRFESIQETRLRWLPGQVIILYVLQGELDVRVSMERFLLVTGDYAVLNAGDPYRLTGSEDSAVITLTVPLDAFESEIPGLHGVIFACESFDLPRYLGSESDLRTQLLDLALSRGDAHEDTARLLQRLAETCAFEDYYERNRQLTPKRRLQFRRLVCLMREHVSKRDLLTHLARKLHYRNSSLSRIVREASATSFSDLAGFVRVARAEILLLETDWTMIDIATACGFSDVKYFTRAFRSWFNQTPSEYRRSSRPLLSRDDVVRDLGDDGRRLAAAQRAKHFETQQPPRLSFTPLLVKNLGSRADLLRAVAKGRPSAPLSSGFPVKPHLLPIEFETVGGDLDSLMELLQETDRRRFRPVIVCTLTQLEPVITAVRDLHARNVSSPEIWLRYRADDEADAEAAARTLLQEQGVTLLPMRIW